MPALGSPVDAVIADLRGGDQADARTRLVTFLKENSQIAVKSLAQAIGVDGVQADAYFADNEIVLDWAGIYDTFDSLPCRYHGTLRSFCARTCPESGARRIPVFDADCLVYPVSFMLKRWRWKLPPDAYVFAMVLPPDVRNARLGRRRLDCDHVANAFAYIRFYVVPDGLLVIEIQSDLYGQIRDGRLRRQYRDWSKLLLASFHAFATSRYGRACSVFMTSAEYQLRRFDDLRPSLAHRLYEHLPSVFGYRETPIDLALEPVHHLQRIARGWRRPAHLEDGELGERLLSKHYSESSRNRLIQSLQLGDDGIN